MGVLIVVENDPVAGTDTHNVSGLGPNPGAPPPTLPYSGVGDYAYAGKVTDALSDFVRIGGQPVTLVTSQSSLDPGQDAPPAGKHSGPQGDNFVAGETSQATQPTPDTLSITDTPFGSGVPSAGAGSGLLTVNGVKVLLDGDTIDTCSGVGGLAGSTVTASGQDFVTCSE
ncbi:MAG: hypothetical protein ACRDTA_24830 [Pseudonocardiaceae bacterium]